MGLGAKIFLATAVVVVAVLGGAVVFIRVQASRTADASVQRGLEATRAAIQDALDARARTLLRVSAGLAQVPTYIARVAQAMREGNQADLLDQADEFREQTGAEWALITDDHGILQAWTLRPQLFDEDFSEGSLIRFALGGDSTEGIWIEPTPRGDQLYQAIGVPIFSPERTRIEGVLVTAVPIDSAFALGLRRQTNSEVVFFAVDTAGVPRITAASLASATLDSAVRSLAPEVETTFEALQRMDASGETWVGTVGALRSADGAYVLGGYLALRSRSQELAPYVRLQNTILWVFFGGLGLAVVGSLVLAGQMTRPIKRLVAVTRDVGDGKYDTAIEVTSRDEIGELAAAFQRMLGELKDKQELVEYLSQAGGATVQLTADQLANVTRAGATAVVGQPADRLRVGQVFAERYEIKEVLGQGGMGVVYRAYDRQLDEPVAIKTLKPDQADETALERFKQEIRLARRITHRNVVRTHDLGQVDGLYYITMEFVEGTSLKDLIRKRGKLPIGVTLTVGKQLCRALEVAHEEGVVHRDIKPQNMVVDATGFLKVMDFGIARLVEGQKAGEGLTAQGVAIGTLEYMAPEQILGEEVDARTDIYAAGCVLFECVTGQPPFSAPSVTALMMKHIEEPPPDPRTVNADVPEALARAILQALAKKRPERWQAAAKLHEALEAVRA